MAIITGRVNLKGREPENLIRCYRGKIPEICTAFSR
jgi:hypothetical protein